MDKRDPRQWLLVMGWHATRTRHTRPLDRQRMRLRHDRGARVHARARHLARAVETGPRRLRRTRLERRAQRQLAQFQQIHERNNPM